MPKAKRKGAKSSAEEESDALTAWSQNAGEAPTTAGAWKADGNFHIGCTGYIDHFFNDGIIDAFMPSVDLKVSYASGATDFGSQMEIKGAIRKPPMQITWTESSQSAGAQSAAQLYTLMFADPDQPSRSKPEQRSVLLWCTANIPSSECKLNKGTGLELAPFQAPKPQYGTHRLLYLLCEQEGGALTAAATPTARIGFNIKEWCAANKLRPVGINFACVHPEY